MNSYIKRSWSKLFRLRTPSVYIQDLDGDAIISAGRQVHSGRLAQEQLAGNHRPGRHPLYHGRCRPRVRQRCHRLLHGCCRRLAQSLRPRL
ncbi:MAG: hypothetical protein MZV64_34685 [Ignavibacteriales bacterium]|nr:hypothetical protein [Ignavibacteriales bacterium]